MFAIPQLKEWNAAFEQTLSVESYPLDIKPFLKQALEVLNRPSQHFPLQMPQKFFEEFADSLVHIKILEAMRLNFLVRQFMLFVNTFPEVSSDGICGNVALNCENHRAYQFQDLVHILIYRPCCRLFHNDFIHVQATLVALVCAQSRVDLLASCAQSLLQATTSSDVAVLQHVLEQLSNPRPLHFAWCNKSNMRIDRSWIGCVCHQRVCECRRSQQPSVADMHLLAFEYSNKIMIRQEQLDMVDEIMMQHRKNRPAIVRQAIMGCGKTSVICPLLALKLSDTFTSHRLVVVVCPPSLLLQTSKQLREKLCLVFKKHVVAFYFDRYFFGLPFVQIFLSTYSVPLQTRC
jgi:hypothetical protein